MWNDKLTQSAVSHSQDMAAKNYFSHDSQDGTSWSARVRRYYNYNTYLAENIAAGYPSVNAVVDGWIASDGHCANLMNPAFQDMGLACVPGTSSDTYRTYWTLDLGKPR